jgi:aldose 1-epimerase
VTVRYVLSTTENAWRIDYRAVTDQPTVVNLSHHDYFNLAGSGAVRDHRLTIPASRFCPWMRA